MGLVPMRFKNYVWPHNPTRFEVIQKRRLSASHIPFGSFVLRDMGESYRVFRGEGEFAGKGAYEEYKKLEVLFREGTPGILVHPLWGAESVYFAGLTLTEEPTPNYVSYTFEFWENNPGYSGKLKTVTVKKTAAESASEKSAETSTYTVRSGDTMW